MFLKNINFLNYIKKASSKADRYNKNFTNPFFDKDFRYNIFKSNQDKTYVWVEWPTNDISFDD